MKLLVFSDIHADLRAASNLVKRSADVDVVVGAGDYGMPRQELDEMISALMKIEKPTVLVSGNCENTDDLKGNHRRHVILRNRRGHPYHAFWIMEL
jgi:predicted phosphodiesterase